jgi:transcriptional regulator of arginine metabolism
MPATKAYRQGQILSLIRLRNIHTQDELAQELKRVGVPATQVTLSRDIRDLGLVKTPEGYRQISERAAGPDLAMLAAEFLLDIRRAQNLLVLKTSPGHANSVAVALDHEQWPEVVGTVAGDDTILVVLPDSETAEAVCERLFRLLETGA